MTNGIKSNYGICRPYTKVVIVTLKASAPVKSLRIYSTLNTEIDSLALPLSNNFTLLEVVKVLELGTQMSKSSISM